MGSLQQLLDIDAVAPPPAGSWTPPNTPGAFTTVMLCLGRRHSYGEPIPLGALCGSCCALWSERELLLGDQKGVAVERAFYGPQSPQSLVETSRPWGARGAFAPHLAVLSRPWVAP